MAADAATCFDGTPYQDVDAGHPATEEEAAVRNLDHQRVLRRSRKAFDEGDSEEGLRLLELAAIYERGGGLT